jgi:hypothetical protein
MISRSRGSRSSKRKVSVPSLSSRSRSQAQNDLVSRGLSYSDSSQNTSTSGLNLTVASQSVASGDIVLLGSNVSFVYYNYVAPPVITYGACVAYGSAVANLGSGTQCSGTYYQNYTDYRYNTRRQILSDGVWDGSSYDTSGCGTTDSRSITSSAEVAGQCGVPVPCTISSYSGWSYSSITWSGSCPSGTESGTATSRSRTDNCGNTYNESGSYAVSRSCTPPCTISSYSAWSYSSITWSGNCVSSTESGTATARSRTDNCGNTYNETGSYAVSRSCTPPAVTWYCTSNYVNGGGGQFTWDSNITGSACGDYAYSCSTSGYPATPTIPNCCSGLNGLPCGYNNTGTYNCDGTCVGASSPPASCVCNYSDQGSYHYAPECCPSGSQRSGSLGGTTVNACCPNVSKTAKFVCKSYDVTNSASNNYSTCYYTGECAANNNSDGSRSVCYV